MGYLTLSPRQAYPLYYALGNLFVWLHPGEPARALNLASAVCGAIAVGFAAWFTTRLTDSLAAGVGAGLFLAFSYTFWSQAITAEVYALHLLILGAAGLSLLMWADTPTVGRLALFYAVFALGFGNHLSMVLLLPAFTVFLLIRRRPGPADPLRPRMLLLAIAIAALGALQYGWNFRGLWADLEPPATLAEAFGKFWFDVTKEDWRETLVMTVSETGLEHRPAMHWFDLRQQFGMPGVALAAVGFLSVLWRWPSRGMLLLLLYAANMAFAWTYNVGDAYIFFMPAHYIVAVCAGAGIGAAAAMTARFSNRAVATAGAALLLLYPAWRGYDTFPAVDRSWDRRAEELVGALMTPPESARAEHTQLVYGLDTNWQLQNAIEYYVRERRPGTVWFITEQFQWLQDGNRLQRFNDFVAANQAIGRRVVMTTRVLDVAHQVPQPRGESIAERQAFVSRVRSVPAGTPYVLAFLRSDREFEAASSGLNDAWEWLAPGVAAPPLRNYTVVAGKAGARPALMQSEDRPYRVGLRLDALDIDIRMESWLPTDTIRRAGFGHVVVDRRHALTLERGISFIALTPGSRPVYGAGLFAPPALYPYAPNP